MAYFPARNVIKVSKTLLNNSNIGSIVVFILQNVLKYFNFKLFNFLNYFYIHKKILSVNLIIL